MSKEEEKYWNGLVDGWKAGYKAELLPITSTRPAVGEDVVVRFKSGQFRVCTRIIDFRGKIKFTLEDLYGPAIGWAPLPTEAVATMLQTNY